jgi:hypothetical protein
MSIWADFLVFEDPKLRSDVLVWTVWLLGDRSASGGGGGDDDDDNNSLDGPGFRGDGF